MKILDKFKRPKKDSTPDSSKVKSEQKEKAKVLSNKEKRRQRWEKQRKEREDLGLRLCKVKSTKKGGQKGAFGKCRGPFSGEAERPKKATGEAAEKIRKERNQRRNARQKMRKTA